jgi:hypothetical protein
MKSFVLIETQNAAKIIRQSFAANHPGERPRVVQTRQAERIRSGHEPFDLFEV